MDDLGTIMICQNHKLHECSVLRSANVLDNRLTRIYRVLGKVMERCILKHTYNYFNSNNLLTPLMSGFTPGDPTVCRLIDLYNTFCSALDDGEKIRVIF
jgi:hypothetical protein